MYNHVLRDINTPRLNTTNAHLITSFGQLQTQHNPTQILDTQKKSPDIHRRILEFVLLLGFLLEPTSYLVDGLLASDIKKIIAGGIGYITFLLAVAIFVVYRKDYNPPSNKKLSILLGMLLLGTWSTSLLNYYTEENPNIFLFLPIIALKIVIVVHYSIPLIFVQVMVTMVTLAGIVVNILFSEDSRSIYQYITGIGAYIVMLPFVFLLKGQRKNQEEAPRKQLERQESELNFDDRVSFEVLGNLEEAVIVVNELGQPIYSNEPFDKLFTIQKEEDILESQRTQQQQQPQHSLAMEFGKVIGIKAKEPELQNRIADLLKGENTTTIATMESGALGRRILRYADSPDSLIIADRESNLNVLFTTFLTQEKMFKANHIGFDPQTRLPKFENFTATLKKNIKDISEVDFQMAYYEMNKKNYLLIVFHFNPYQKELKEAQAESEHRKQMLRYVAHDMRNPLSSVQLLLETAIDDTFINATVKNKYIRPCVKNLKYLFALVNDLIDAAQISAGKFKLAISETHVAEIVDDVIQIFELKAKAKEITLKKVVDSRLPGIIFTDPARVNQILINLVSNALKYTPKKGTITIKVDSNILNANKIDFSVEDTGIGIRMENQKDLLKDFSKVEGSKDSELNPYGVGLGLSLSNKLAIQLNIEAAKEGIKIDSTLGKGTKMKFSVENRRMSSLTKISSLAKIPTSNLLTLNKKASENYSSCFEENHPVESAKPNSSQSLTSEGRKARRTLTTLRRLGELDALTSGHVLHSKALVIDDDAFSAETLSMILNSMGITADKVYNTKDAVKKLEELAAQSKGNNDGRLLGYDLIFMDGMMDDMDGFESTRILKAKMKAGEVKDCPVVFCTGLDADSEAQAREAGAGYYITKPITKVKLGELLKAAGIKNGM